MKPNYFNNFSTPVVTTTLSPDVVTRLRIDFILSKQTYFFTLISVVAIITNIIFLGLVIRGCRSRDLPVKRFLFVSNRSAADLVAALVTLGYFINRFMNNCELDIRAPEKTCTVVDGNVMTTPLEAAITLDYWTVAVSYTGVALLTVYAVKNPIRYKTRLTVRHVCYCILLSWMVMITALIVIYAVFGYFSNIPSKAVNSKTRKGVIFDVNVMIYVIVHHYFRIQMSDWISDLCINIDQLDQMLITVVSLAIPVLLLFTAVCSYIMVANALCTRRNSQYFRQNRGALLRLGMHLAIFTITVILMAMSYVNTFTMKDHCTSGDQTHDVPFWYICINFLATSGWLLRMTADPIIDVLIDGVLRKSFVSDQRHRLSTFTLSTKDEGHKLSVTVFYRVSTQQLEPLLHSSRL